MSFSINTNGASIDALRNIDKVNQQLLQAQNRLSTGLRINSSGDDPAGLIISDAFSTQIIGVQQSSKNAQDGINLLKTADSALGELTNLLQNLRTIAVASANSATQDAATLQGNQQQIASILQSIDRIASNSSFGSINLLDGTAGIHTAISDPADILGIAIGSTFGGSKTVSGLVTLAQVTQSSAASATLGNVFATATATVGAGAFQINGVSFLSDGTKSVQAIVNQINEQTNKTGVAASIVASGGGVSIKLDQANYGAQYSVALTDGSHLLNNSSLLNVAGTDAVYNVTAPTANGAKTVTFTGGRNAGDSGLKLTDGQGNTIILTPASNSGLTALGSIGGSLNLGQINFQIGAASGQATTVTLPNVSSNQLATTAIAGLTLANADVTTPSGAQQAITLVDAAIDQITSLRASIGSTQSNVLQSTQQWLDTASENLQSSRSQVLDTDIAQAVSEQTRLQILQQSGLAVLAQANQDPAAVIQLLKQ
ncbi:MAG: hypothetical protein JSS72_01260 [Armatimonadetes bacterium]|nr:hypothetical protein [Armatimonadota bacterium]